MLSAATEDNQYRLRRTDDGMPSCSRYFMTVRRDMTMWRSASRPVSFASLSGWRASSAAMISFMAALAAAALTSSGPAVPESVLLLRPSGCYLLALLRSALVKNSLSDTMPRGS